MEESFKFGDISPAVAFGIAFHLMRKNRTLAENMRNHEQTLSHIESPAHGPFFRSARKKDGKIRQIGTHQHLSERREFHSLSRNATLFTGKKCACHCDTRRKNAAPAICRRTSRKRQTKTAPALSRRDHDESVSHRLHPGGRFPNAIGAKPIGNTVNKLLLGIYIVDALHPGLSVSDKIHLHLHKTGTPRRWNFSFGRSFLRFGRLHLFGELARMTSKEKNPFRKSLGRQSIHGSRS